MGADKSLLAQILEKETRQSDPPCVGCGNLTRLKSGSLFCVEKDKFILEDLPPTKCE
jgi:hypothetical protein